MSFLINPYRFVAPLYVQVLPLINANAEAGNITGWTNAIATSFAATAANPLSSTEVGSGIGPYAGSYSFSSGGTSFAAAYQDISLAGLDANILADIDAGRITADCGGFLVTDKDNTDWGHVDLMFYTSGGAWLGGAMHDGRLSQSAWRAFTETALKVPETTRIVRLMLRGWRNGGDANTQVYWDEISARLNRKAGTHTCILSLNGASTAGWTNVVNTLITATVASSSTGGNAWGYDPGLRWGTGSTSTGHAWHAQSLPSTWQGAIDAGVVTLEANFQLACTTSTPQASGRVYVEFYDAGSSQLGSRVYSDPAEASPARQSARRKQFSTPVPANARSIRFGIMGTRVSGTSLNAIFSSFSYINVFLER
ncbi:hypothetical protein [Hyphomonas sp.]|uniref:hypothetical protein n=1 Tax=Hyphomonas sp. TaxID=87 RepID=UPI0025BA8568|nr:hypothetical protein [Hyphomonas sp.]